MAGLAGQIGAAQEAGGELARLEPGLAALRDEHDQVSAGLVTAASRPQRPGSRPARLRRKWPS